MCEGLVGVTELGGDPSLVTLTDDVVVLRPWTRSEASFIAEASRDPAIERYNGPVGVLTCFGPT